MQTRHVLLDAFARVRQNVARVTDGLDGEALAWRPDPGANSIAWLVWHATRIQDDHVADLAGRPQAWTDDGWAERFALPFDRHDTGFGHTAEDVAAVRLDGPGLLVDYHEAVVERTTRYLDVVDADELSRIVDESWDPPVTAGVRLVSVIDDNAQHLGQAAYLRGMLERRTG